MMCCCNENNSLFLHTQSVFDRPNLTSSSQPSRGILYVAWRAIMQSNHFPFVLFGEGGNPGEDQSLIDDSAINTGAIGASIRARIASAFALSDLVHPISHLSAHSSLNFPFPSWSSFPQGPMVPPNRLFVRVGPSSAGPLCWAGLVGVF